MKRGDDELFAVIEAVHAAGLEPERRPDVLARLTGPLGGLAGTVEVFETRSRRLTISSTASRRSASTNISSTLPRRTRASCAARFLPADEVLLDCHFIDERGIDRDPYYAELLTPYDFRYFVCGKLIQARDEQAVFAVQRSRRQGHAGERDIALMRQLIPHVRQALDVTRRLRGAKQVESAFERALEWLTDGVALLRADGALIFANQALRAIAKNDDGIRIAKAGLKFANAETRAALAAALRAAGRVADREAGVVMDFVVARPSGAPPYLVSVRPLMRASRERLAARDATAVVYIRDPAQPNRAVAAVLREVFGFTVAEAALAQALQSGLSLADYVRERGISLNTAYTHLRRIREKTGCRRMAELIRKLNDVQVQLRRD